MIICRTNVCLLLLHKFYRDRWATSHVVQRKGADQWASKNSGARSGAEWASELHKSDGKHAIKALEDVVVRKLREKLPQHRSKVGGPVALVRVLPTLSSSLWPGRRLMLRGEFHGIKSELTHLVRVLTLENASQLFNRGVKDNTTAYGLRKGGPYKRKLPPSAEAVMYLSGAENRRRRKFEDRRATGIYLALVERSNMVLVGTPAESSKVNCIQRLPAVQAQDPELVKASRAFRFGFS